MFHRNCRHRRRWHPRQRRHRGAIALSILWVLLGCFRTPDREWQKHYDEARKKLWDGSFEQAFQEADQNYRKSARESSVWSWRFLTLKAQARQFQGRSKEALQLLGPDVPLSLPRPVRARVTIVKGDTLCRLRELQGAEALLTQADGLIGNDQDLGAELALARGRCAQWSDLAAAKRYFRAASDLSQAADEYKQATGLLNLAFVLLGEKNYDDAIHALVDGLKVTSSPLLREKILGNLGYAYSQIGEFRRAIPFSQEAQSLAVTLKSDRDEMKWLIDLGRERFTQLEYQEAADSLGKALKIAGKLADSDGKAICLNNLAQLALRTKDLGKAEDYTRQLEDLKPKGEHYLDLLLNQGELAKARQDLPSAERLLRQLLTQMANDQNIDPAVRWKTESDLAAAYVAHRKFDLAEKMFIAAVATANSARTKAKGVELKISFLDQAPFYDDYVKFLVSRKRPLEALSVAELGRSPTLSEGLDGSRSSSHPGLSLERVQAALKRRHQIVLAYWLGLDKSYLWVITSSQVKLFHLPAELEIEKRAEAYNREIRESEHPERSNTGRELYNILVGPAKPFVNKGASVVVVPQRNLHNFNFETLIVPDPIPHYWIEDVHLQNASFLGALTGPERLPSGDTTKELLLVGAPVLADKRFPVLKQAGPEVKKIKDHFPAERTTIIAGKNATPQAYLASNPGQFRLLHFVTHGTSSTVLENPLDSAIILSPIQSSAIQATGVSVPDPGDSYMLYGKEIMKTPLQAELVTVSACYGLGREYSGEGMVGLAWAFMRAGAHQVIAGLWEVDDASSPQLMDDFYGELSQGKSAAEALRDAKLKMLHSTDFHNQPYYWASLQLYTGS